MDLSVIIATHNRKQNLLELTKILSRILSGKQAEIIVVNDIPEQNISESLPPEVIYLENRKGGAAVSRNMGARRAQYNKLIFLDDDMLVNTEAIETAIRFLDNHELSLLNVNWEYPENLLRSCQTSYFGRYLLAVGHHHLKGWMSEEEWKENRLNEVESLGSAFLAIRKIDFVATGGYDETISADHFDEDLDFVTKAKSANIKFFLDTSVTIFHNESENIVPEKWLARKYKNAFTRGIAVSHLKMTELTTSYTTVKGFAFRFIFSQRKGYLKMLSLLTKFRIPDSIYQVLFDKLHGAYLYTGYQQGIKTTEQSFRIATDQTESQKLKK